MISVIIPAYNEAENIKETVDDIIKILNKTEYGDQLEIIIVDDHSSDNTFEKIQQISGKNITGIRLSHRSGSHTALRAGMHEAKGDAVICISADGQDDPLAIPKMLEKWKNGADIVWALRNSRENEPWHIKIPALIFYKVLNTVASIEHADEKIALSRADFYLLDKKVLKAINACHEQYTSLFGLIVWLGFNQNFIEYDRKNRRSGGSKWNFKSRLKLATDWIIAFSGLPLKAMMGVGFSIALIGFAYAFFIIISFYYGHTVPGWASIMIVTLILGGINLSMLGLVGEYLWRNLEESRKRPLYFIEKTFKGNKND